MAARFSSRVHVHARQPRSRTRAGTQVWVRQRRLVSLGTVAVGRYIEASDLRQDP